jgi:hypothetical protein
LLIISASIAKAQSTFSANRPGQVDNPDITPKGNLMIEAGFQYGKTPGSVNYLLPTTSVRYGLNKSIEISLNADNIYQVETSLFGLTAYNIGSKIAICEETRMLPKIAFVTAYYLPFAGVKSLRPKNGGGLIQLAISHSIGDKCTIYSNLGATWNGKDSFPVYNYVVSLYLSLFSRFWTFAELYGLIPEKGENNMGLDCGFSYQAGDNFQVDLAIGADPVDVHNNHYVQIGAAFQIIRKDK